MNFSKSQLIILGIGAAIILAVILIILGGGRRPVSERAQLSFWGIESSGYFSAAIEEFEKNHPGNRIVYRRIDEAIYEKELIDAFAAGSGPDVFMFGSKWLARHSNKVSPAPVEKMTMSRFSDLFPQIAEEDLTMEGNVYAVPLYIDTLVLYYNRDTFDRLAIPLPPRTWDDFKGVILIKKAPASFGGYAPLVTRAADIMNALLMQSGADLDLRNKDFVRLVSAAGERALDFYIQFNAPSEDSITGFSGERIAMMLGYHSDMALVKEKNPFLNIGVAALPQFFSSSPVVPARYYGLAVSDKSKYKDLSWDFALSIAADEAIAESFITNGSHPPALRSLIQKYSDDGNFGVFSRQALIARSWFEPDDREVVTILNDMIRSAISSRVSRPALQTAEERINRLITK